MGLSMQYFLIYTLLAVDRAGNQFTSNAHLGVQKSLGTVCTTVTYATMQASTRLNCTLEMAQS